MKTLHVPRRADGETSALLVPGNDLCAEFYVPLAERLANRGVDVTLLTLPGFHREPPYDAPSWSRFAADVADAVSGLAAERTALIGHSMGAVVALLAAARLHDDGRDDDLDQLVLVEPTFYPNRFTARSGSRKYLARVVHDDRSRFVNSTGFMPRVHDLDRYPKAMLALYLEVRQTSDVATADALFRTLPDLYPLPFSSVRVPTLLVTGAEVGLRGKVAAWLTERRLPDVSHRVVPRAAHWIVNEADDVLCEDIAAFLAGATPGPAPSS